MRREEVSLDEALNITDLLSQGYQYIWLMEISSVQLQKLENVELHPDELIEARIFSKEKEIHIFEYEDQLKAVRTITDPDDMKVKEGSGIPDFSYQHYHERKQLLREKYGKTITFRDFFNVDDDGMTYIEHTVLCDVGGLR